MGEIVLVCRYATLWLLFLGHWTDTLTQDSQENILFTPVGSLRIRKFLLSVRP